MYSANIRILLVCCSRAQLLKRLVQSQVSNCVYLRFATCSVNRERKKGTFLSTSVTPVKIKPSRDSLNVGEELAGSITKSEIMKVLNEFCRLNQVKVLAAENGINENIYQKGISSFRNYCVLSQSLPADLHITFSDIIKKAGNVMDILPYFLKHVKEVFPHLGCLEDLKKVGDIRMPANWFPLARNKERKFYFHCGPTNSGKTFQAINRFLNAKSGVYCAPLKLLAVEVYEKTNKKGIPCDLITGEDLILVNSRTESSHISCTVEMCCLDTKFEVAVIDEIQMLRDPQRGWAWTRALLGLIADEIHLCGEEAAIDIVDSILCTTGEKLEVKYYDRLTKLHIDSPLESLSNVKPGDCIVCFNRLDIFSVARNLEYLKHNVAIIYGALPPQTKLSQCEKFNDPKSPCTVMVATDAIGMGLNLNIRRIIFYSLTKIMVKKTGEVEKGIISVSQALQIAGRAGRFGSKYEEGLVTTFKSQDLDTLQCLLSKKPEKIHKAGIQPTLEQIELFSYYLPKSSLSQLIEIFYDICTVDDSLYFMCDLTEFKYLAQLLEHIPLPICVKYIFCNAPVNRKMHFNTTLLVEFAKMYSLNQVVDANWISQKINWPLEKPKNWRELLVLESYHEGLDLYLWLSYRFEEYFLDRTVIKAMQNQIDSLIQYGVFSLSKYTYTEDSDLEIKGVKKQSVINWDIIKTNADEN